MKYLTKTVNYYSYLEVSALEAGLKRAEQTPEDRVSSLGGRNYNINMLYWIR